MGGQGMTDSGITGKCSDIYADEIKKQINTLKRFREVWLRSSSAWNSNIFQYADPDFYFFRFAIDRQEQSTEPFLTRVLFRLMERYGVTFEVPEEVFTFIVCEKEKRYGYRFKDFYQGDDINDIIQQCKVDEAFILNTWKPGRSDEWISRENKHYAAEGLKLKSITLASFFSRYFGEAEYNDFLSEIQQYLEDAREITGYKSIKFFSKMNLATQKTVIEKTLVDPDTPYKNYEFQIIDRTDPRIKDFLYFSHNLFPSQELKKMEENYLTSELYKAMIGSEEFAESFLTSEWLFYSLEELKHFDYTSVISGYLKSVEQLLYKIVKVNVGNNCKISMSSADDIVRDARLHGVKIYKWDNKRCSLVPTTEWKAKYKYIDLVPAQEKYMDNSIGTFEYFLRNNPHIFVFPARAKTIADMVSCFRTECRNEYFHMHNLSDWDIVKKVRSNAIFLYYVLLGGCIIPQSKMVELGILSTDSFDELCKKIREFRHYNPEFIFEYADGTKKNLIFDTINNTIDYTDEGVEHYHSLIFYEVEKFCLEAYEKLDEGIREDQIVYLTRNTLPFRIIGIHRDGRTEEISF